MASFQYIAGMSKPHNLPNWKAIFLEALRRVPVLGPACDIAQVDRSTAFRNRQSDKEFDAAVKDALTHGVDEAEAEAFRRAVQGYDEPLIHKGKVTCYVEHYEVATGDPVSESEYETNQDLPTGDPDRRHLRWRYQLDAAGQRRPVTIKKHSDQLLVTILRGRRKEVYAERVETTGAGGGPVQTMDTTTRAARVLQLMAIAQLRKDNEDLA